MSQHFFSAGNQVEGMVGWDNALGTFFGQVYKVDEEGERIEDDDEGQEKGTLLWVGARRGEIRTVDELEEKLKPVARIPADIRKKLFEVEVD
jgi:hypothetical protein